MGYISESTLTSPASRLQMVPPWGVHPVGPDRCMMACVHRYGVSQSSSLPQRVSTLLGSIWAVCSFFIYFKKKCSCEHSRVCLLVTVCLVSVGCPQRGGIAGHGVCAAQVTRYCQTPSRVLVSAGTATTSSGVLDAPRPRQHLVLCVSLFSHFGG